MVRTAISVGAQAIHPGYGYMSENADFATRVRDAGLYFIGPSSAAMSTLGDKRSSKDYLSKNAPDVPLIPGFTGSSQDVAALRQAAEEIGFPVMLKASAGGGGKGMRIVREAAQLENELERAQSEAQRSFGSSDCILEKYVESSKHVEIQIVGDAHGDVFSFFDRDCSVQRRHQKVIEETPCPFISDDIRSEMGATAIRIAKLIGYENAGTVEFVLDTKTGRYYFLEVNARLQVEHPITEEVTGVDLVSLQLYVAAGGKLSTLAALQDLKQNGHAIECRLCAEDPQRNFFPEHGTVHLWLPATNDFISERDVRYETAIQTGGSVSIHFDSMVAKIVVWAPTRALAIDKMIKALSETACVGVKTNQLFLQACLSNKAFCDPAYTTSFIPNNLDELLQAPWKQNDSFMRDIATIIPSLVVQKLPHYASSSGFRKPFQNVRSRFRNQRFDPVSAQCDIITLKQWPEFKTDQKGETKTICIWAPSEWGSSPTHDVYLVPVPDVDETQRKEASASSLASSQYNAISQKLRDGYEASSITHKVKIESWKKLDDHGDGTTPWRTTVLKLSINGKRVLAYIALPSIHSYTLAGEVERAQHVFYHLPHIGTWVESKRDTLRSFAEGTRSLVESRNDAGGKIVTAPMPCKVLNILKKNGDEVKPGDSVMIIESMKMEVNISVSAGGKFETGWKTGNAVSEGQILCSVV